MRAEPPPGFHFKLLKWFCKPDYHSDIEGDLLELYDRRIKKLGAKKAKWLLYKDVLLLFRPGIIRTFKTSQKLNHYTMLRHNFVLSIRNFKRYKNSFLINLTGLSVGLTCFFLIFLWVQDEVSIDKFHEKDSQLYQVMHNLHLSNGIRTTPATPAPLAKALAEEIPEIEFAVSKIPVGFFNEYGVLSTGKKYIKAAEQYASEDYFKIFSIQLLRGDKSSVLVQKNGVVISSELAVKLFKTSENVIGKDIKWTKADFSGDFIVTGIFEKPPKTSTSQFDLIFSLQMFLDQEPYLEKWWNSDPRTYVTLAKGADPGDVNQKIEKFIQSKLDRSNSSLFLQRYSERYLNGNYENGQVAGGRVQYVRLFSIVAILILIIACINFINLSTAQASRRVKEIGVKKAIGASRKGLIFQFLGESMLMTIISLLAAGIMALLFLPIFNEIVGKELTIQPDYRFIIGVLGLTMVTGIMSGVYPAFYLSRFNSVSVLKGSLSRKSDRGLSRQGLVIFQFSVSIILIISVVVIYKQIGYIQSKNLGYNRNHIIYVNNDGQLNENLEPFLTMAKNVPGVINATIFGHDLVGDYGGTTGVSWEGKDPEERIRFGNLEVGYDFIETLSIEMAEGRSYSRDFQTDRSKIIFNEAAIAAMGLEDPIGKTIVLWGDEKQIIGVVKNFHFESLYEEVKPCFLYLALILNKTLIKIQPGTETATISQIQNIYNKFNEGFPFEYKYLNDDYQDMYASEKRIAILSRYFCGIAILISCLGLFGLVAFTYEKRLKEIGIRKILGAGSFRIVYMLSSDFTKMVLISIGFAIPVSYLVTKKWLDGFAYRIELEWWFFASAGLIALIVAWLTLSLQTVKAANINPVQCLRDE